MYYKINSVLQSTTPYQCLPYHPVLPRTTPVPLCITKCHSVLQKTTPVPPCTTKNSFLLSTCPYSKILLQDYEVLFRTTKCHQLPHQYSKILVGTTTPILFLSTLPVLLGTSRYHSSTAHSGTALCYQALCYKAPFQYHCVPKSTTPVYHTLQYSNSIPYYNVALRITK